MIWHEDPALVAAVEEAMEGYLSALDVPEPLRSALQYGIQGGGKRLRPLLLLKSNACFGGDREEALPLACALEMIHTYSLIHDDLPAMDNDVLRRGRPTHHVVYGEAMAILAGDGLLNLAYEVMLNHVPSRPERAARYIAAARVIARAAGVSGMVAGQSMDIRMERDAPGQVTLADLERMQQRKTGALFSAAMVGGALSGGAGEEALAAVREYALHAGMLFQIVDDILDVVGDEQALGKTVGKDARAGKATYVSLLGLEGAWAQAELHAGRARAAAARFDRQGFFTRLIEDLVHRNG